ncbi:MAG: hypothetical protein KH100_15700 [Dysgonomonas mossii]|uniref:hypothetical protein n=1 Tax=Dysgonomonas mossii TaxID=163665 RepID=UPI001D2C6BB3|nr:hypothetical protein [Dysgonomonas mossii]MBS7112627.1 hypothetical protein [Dysgonomonas mossii]
MEAAEYRIGNLLRDKVSKTLLEVIELTKENVVTYVIDRNMFPLKDGWSLEPIPITAEWLLKLGFFHSESLDMYLLKIQKEKWICWNKDKGITLQDVNRTLFEYKKIKYVHQLQNLYFATHQEELKPEQS